MGYDVRFKRYNNLYVPILLEERRAEYIRDIINREDVCMIGIACDGILCSECVFQSPNSPPSIEWFVENGYFTSSEALDASLNKVELYE